MRGYGQRMIRGQKTETKQEQARHGRREVRAKGVEVQKGRKAKLERDEVE
jgi:hypothetical protein